MEFHVRLTQTIVDLMPIEEAIRALDPAAQVDVGKANGDLRIAAYVEAAELVSVLDRAGYPVHPDQVVQLPSICCGGCGG